ncbi:MAG: NAD(P)H-dependent glycerol-3-phosphate dehydrogenase [Pseudomonadota bacterium]
MSAPLKFAVLGAGSWGTALAVHLSFCGYETVLWARNVQHVAEMQSQRENARYLAGISFPPQLVIDSNLEQVLTKANVILLATPSSVFEIMLNEIKPHLHSSHILLSATKGLTEHGEFMSDLAQTILPNTRYALLSGPSFAKEVAKHLPTTVIIASRDKECAHQLAHSLSKNVFRVYSSQDLIGVQIGGAVKNILAVAVGISDGMGFGANARAALMTRGLREMKRLGLAAGGELTTIMGLAGLGDLVLTCTDNQSRNRRLGLAIGQGKSIQEAQIEIGQVIESIGTSALIQTLIKRFHVEMPITEQVYQVLHHKLEPKQAVKNLFARSLKAE